MRTSTSYSLATELYDLELQLTHGAEQDLAAACDGRPVELNRPFLRALLEPLQELLAPQRVGRDEAPEVLGREARNRLEGQIGPVGDRYRRSRRLPDRRCQ